jgi:hypothetical protein
MSLPASMPANSSGLSDPRHTRMQKQVLTATDDGAGLQLLCQVKAAIGAARDDVARRVGALWPLQWLFLQCRKQTSPSARQMMGGSAERGTAGDALSDMRTSDKAKIPNSTAQSRMPGRCTCAGSAAACRRSPRHRMQPATVSCTAVGHGKRRTLHLARDELAAGRCEGEAASLNGGATAAVTLQPGRSAQWNSRSGTSHRSAGSVLHMQHVCSSPTSESKKTLNPGRPQMPVRGGI